MGRIIYRLGWLAAAVLSLVVAASLAGVVRGGSLNPPGPPGSTMKTLDDIPGSWSRQLSVGGGDPCQTQRFQCIMQDQAVLDSETGLVWQIDGAATANTWAEAMYQCYVATTGVRAGWRLPTFPELLTLAAADGTSAFMAGSPFLHIMPGGEGHYYWTASAGPYSSADALAIGWDYAAQEISKTTGWGFGTIGHTLCVRAGEPIATD